MSDSRREPLFTCEDFTSILLVLAILAVGIMSIAFWAIVLAILLSL